MKLRIPALAIGLLLVAAACSSSSSESDAAPTTAAGTPTTTVAGEAPAESTTTAAEPAPTPGGDSAATITLDNGESFTFSILCNLESQEAAGQELLFTVVSYDEPYGFDVTQFGKGSDDTAGLLDGFASISIYDSTTFDDIWSADTVVAQLSQTEFVLELDGNTITGSATFLTGEDAENLKFDAGVPGELVANCG